MKKTTLMLASILILTLTGACAENPKAEEKEPKPRYYEIMAIGTSYEPRSFSPSTFATYIDGGKIGTAIVEGVSADENVEVLVGSCLYGNLRAEDVVESLVITSCPE